MNMLKKKILMIPVMVALGFCSVVSLKAEDAFPLTLVKESVMCGNISPDGQMILFVLFNESKSHYELGIHNLGTRENIILLSADNIAAPRMDPTGKRITFMGSVKVQGVMRDGLWVLNSDGSGLKAFPALIPADVQDGYAFWSPDGSQIAFTRNGQIWIAKADGSGTRILADGGPDSFALVLDWMDKTLLIARSDSPASDYRLYLLDLETENLTATGLEVMNAIFIDSIETILYGNGPLRIWNVFENKQNRETLPIEPSFSSFIDFSRSADSSRVLLDAKDEMDTSINHLYLIDTD